MPSTNALLYPAWGSLQPVRQERRDQYSTSGPRHEASLGRSERLAAADQLVVAHAAVREHDGAFSLNTDAGAKGQARTQYHCIEQVAFEPEIFRDRAVVERTGQR
jgi:hypothetical protein